MSGSKAGYTREPGSGNPVLMFGGLGLFVSVVGAIWGALTLAGGQQVPGNPFSAVFGLINGTLTWSTSATVWVAIFVAVAATVLVAVLRLRRRGGRERSRIDHAQRHLASGRDIASITARRRKGSGIVVDGKEVLGVSLGRTLNGGAELVGSWEDMHLDVTGPRVGKSTSRIIPAICEAPGPVLTTENKRGNLDHTRKVRERWVDGQPTKRVWVFDPQSVANEQPTWWWNPLSYVTDEEKAQQLAELFADGDEGEAAKKDPYFDPEGQDLLANLLLASALAGEPISLVYSRLTVRDRCREAVQILRTHGYELLAQGLQARMSLAPKQADGIFGTATKMAGCLRLRRVQPWVSKMGEDDTRPHLDITDMLLSNETVYALSREGVGSVGPLVAALTVAVCEEAERIATASPGGRLAIPLLCALDEAANVVRWRRLPTLYSHYGSRGIIIMTILQSWSQGVRTFGEHGMNMLWSAANVKVYGGGVDEKAFLEMLSALVGSYDRTERSVSHQGGNSYGSTSTRTHKEIIFDVAQLRAWPRGRMLIFSSGNPPTIVRGVPWFDRPYAAEVTESLQMYSPTPELVTKEAVAGQQDSTTEPTEMEIPRG